MKLYKISDIGELVILQLLDFNSNEVYLVDDQEKSTIYIWVGLNVPQYLKDITAAYARRFEKERGDLTKIHIMKEKREFGSFLAMKELLQKGEIPGQTIERRPELILQSSSQISITKTESPPQTEISSKESVNYEELDLETQIREAAYYLSLEKYSYNDLCWLLAEKVLKVNVGMPSLDEIRKKAEEVFHSSSTYDELCWLNAEMDILIIRGFLEKKKIGIDL
jgi:hypothetical protein